MKSKQPREAGVSAVQLRGVSCHFGPVRAVDHVSLDIAVGTFFAMLGPSGSGKTTCLRLMAGFEQPTSGSIVIFGHDMTGVPPYRRNVNTVFQDYALFPHMSVGENVAYGLRVRGIGKAERTLKAEEMLALVKLDGYAARKPSQLSGGQRQRVALARALVNRPKVLLLDEPLGALDLKLREQMQIELKSLQRELGITFVFVTHDQGEALSMADHVAVFNAGRIVQVGSPEAIYERPETRFVADFVGGSNVIEPGMAAELGMNEGLWSLRPEKIALEPGGSSGVRGHVETLQYQGAYRRYDVTVGRGRLTVVAPAVGQSVAPGDAVSLSFPIDAAHRMEG